jgi:hypothetical protein
MRKESAGQEPKRLEPVDHTDEKIRKEETAIPDDPSSFKRAAETGSQHPPRGESIRKYAGWVVLLVTAASLSIKRAGGSWMAAVAGGVAMLAAMVIIRIFAEVIGVSKNRPQSIHGKVLSWISLLAFCFVLLLLIVKFSLVLFNDGAAQNPTPPTAKSDAAQGPTPKTSQAPAPTVSGEPEKDSVDRVAVSIKVMRGGALPDVRHAILHVRLPDYTSIQLAPNDDGIAATQLNEGRFTLSIEGVNGELGFNVAKPQTVITVRVNYDNQLTFPGSADSGEQSVVIEADRSKWVLDDQVHLSVIGISYQGDPLRHLVTFSIDGPHLPNHVYSKRAVGTVVRAQMFTVRVTSIDTFRAEFLVSREGGPTGRN